MTSEDEDEDVADEDMPCHKNILCVFRSDAADDASIATKDAILLRPKYKYRRSMRAKIVDTYKREELEAAKRVYQRASDTG